MGKFEDKRKEIAGLYAAFVASKITVEKAIEERNTLRNQLTKANNEMKDMQTIPGRPHLSDHALVRCLERLGRIDIEALKAEILKDLPDDLPDGQIAYNGAHLVIKNNTIVTVLED